MQKGTSYEAPNPITLTPLLNAASLKSKPLQPSLTSKPTVQPAKTTKKPKSSLLRRKQKASTKKYENQKTELNTHTVKASIRKMK
jgi:hypothetical protein